MSVNQRVKQVRITLKLSQARFAEQISISSGYIAGIELEKRKVNERIIKLICSTFSVNGYWLKTGEGDMFIEGAGVKSDQALKIFSELRPEFQDYALQQIDKLLELQKATLGDRGGGEDAAGQK